MAMKRENLPRSESVSKDVLFIHPGKQSAEYQDLAREFTAVAPPVWTALLANEVRKRGYDVCVHDVNVQGWDDATARELLNTRDPALIVMMVYGHHPSASTQTMPAAGGIARDIKRIDPDRVVAIGGLHPSALPARTLAEEAVDFVIQGEGADTIIGLLGHHRGLAPLSDVRGLWYREDGQIRSRPPAALETPLEGALGGYAWDLLPGLDRYRAHTMHCFQHFEQSASADFSDVRSPYATLFTSLGCPYSCDYCSVHALTGRPSIRYWSLETVVSWIDALVEKHGVRNIRIDDELFIFSPERVERFCDLLIARGHDLNLWVYGRVDAIAPALLRKMKRAGIAWVCLGIEAASERVRRDVNKAFRGDVGTVVGSIQEHGIHVLGNFMFGLPEDDLATMEETLRLALELKCEFANFYTTMAYPGSALYDRHAGSPLLPQSWEGYAQLGYECRPLPTRHISAREVLRFRDEAFRRYFTDPGYLARAQSLFGRKVVDHIGRMVSMPVRRRLLEEESS
jgi:radical SAM superfamily enzyme YgiQ (UPF0313 family)